MLVTCWSSCESQSRHKVMERLWKHPCFIHRWNSLIQQSYPTPVLWVPRVQYTQWLAAQMAKMKAGSKEIWLAAEESLISSPVCLQSERGLLLVHLYCKCKSSIQVSFLEKKKKTQQKCYLMHSYWLVSVFPMLKYHKKNYLREVFVEVWSKLG